MRSTPAGPLAGQRQERGEAVGVARAVGFETHHRGRRAGAGRADRAPGLLECKLP
jgi:hypothetical protein